MSRTILQGLDTFFRVRSWGDIEPMPAESARRSIPTRCKWAEGGAKLSGVEAIRGFNQTMELRRLAALLFGKIDYLISPTAPVPAFPAERCSPGDDPERPFEHICFYGAVEFDRAAGGVDQCGIHGDPACRSACRSSAAASTITACSKLAKAWETARGPITNWPKPPR